MTTYNAASINCECGHPGIDGHNMRQSPPECLTPGCICGLYGATADGSSVHRVGRWVVRIAPEPADLYLGTDRTWTRERATYETGTIVEVYDAKYVEGFTPLGQFVTAYGARTLTDSAVGRGTGLILDGGIPAWRMSADEFTTVLGLIARWG